MTAEPAQRLPLPRRPGRHAPREVPASVGQSLLWHLDRARGGHGALNCPMVCRLTGPLDEAALGAAVAAVTARHESLRTTVERRGRKLVQVVHPPAGLADLLVTDLRGSPDPDGAAQEALRAELHTPTDAAHGPLRLRLWRTGAHAWLLAWTMHHVVTDTWSCDVVFRDLAAAYARQAGTGPELPPPGWQYAQFTAWQQRRFERGALARHEDYWRARLAGAAPARMPFTVGGAEAATGARATVLDRIPPDTAARLDELATRHRTTPFAVLLAVHYALLHVETGQADLAVSTLFANRTRPELHATVGFLTNMVVLRTAVPTGATFADLVERTRQTVVDAITHQELPFHVVSRAASAGDGPRLDDVVFQMLAESIEQRVEAASVVFEGVVPDVAGRFDLELAVMPDRGGYAVKFYFPGGRVDEEDARAFLRAYAATAAVVARDPQRPLAGRTP